MDQERHFLDTVRKNRDRMYRVAMSYLHTGADAEDAVSAAVEAAWTHFWKLRNPDALGPYLIRCVINASKNELRRRKRLVPLDSVQESLITDKTGDLLFEYICGLEDKYRIPLILRMQERMTEKEIAEVLRVPRGTVSTRISRALNELKKQMAKEGIVYAEE
ncbi:RNA polymerase sigma factor [Aristaeella lactis]|uniref:RNA polymerase sigma-70 factor, ECF subfamily n=1 Tax=Aristaeella lactis TaxID=3046383 RepID=A0AC61PL10_9FIRM|nr:sigma-70 family RNA polymerase sigma factor [Aristaeella lactis]QUA52001.1 sigma-70 family RNA polymerase sigma factor [Aristaeella lactis]SMC54720.1 RNA polymerase sigma-70 factor, ECF subfamily [Aristaeella lactis]